MRCFIFSILLINALCTEAQTLVGTIYSEKLAEEDVTKWKRLGKSPIYVFDRTYDKVHLRGYIERTDSDLKDWQKEGFRLKVFVTHFSGKLIDPIPIAEYARYMSQSDVEVKSTTYIYSDNRIVYVHVLDQSPHLIIEGQPMKNDSIVVKNTYTFDPVTGDVRREKND